MTSSGMVLVTGGGGFIGSHLVDLLVAEGQQVRVLEIEEAAARHLPEAVEVVQGDIRDLSAVERCMEGCDIVLHLAANPNLWARNPAVFEQVNHQGTRHVLAAARSLGIRRTVHVSTESILARADSKEVITEQTQTELADMIGPYCRSKWLAEQAGREAAEAGQPVIIVSPTVPIGPGDRRQGPVSRMICDFFHGRIKGFLVGDINLIDVRDVAAGIWSAACRGKPGRRYLLAHENWTIQELLGALSEVGGRSSPTWKVPYPVALTFAHLEEWFCQFLAPRRIPMATVTGIRLTQRAFRFDGTQSAKELGLQPLRGCREAIRETIEWYREAGVLSV